MSWYNHFPPYVSVAKRQAQAAVFAAKLAKKENRTLAPIKIPGRIIAASFWGKAWCDNLERYSDYSNRLPRGRTYVRNGSVIDLQIERGQVQALVSGSAVYKVTITIKTVPAAAWTCIKKDCTRSIDSLIDLLQARFDQGVMERLTQRDGGLFPQPREIGMACSCPDGARMCKHVAAVLYGIGARLDKASELLFTLRDVDHLELISQAVSADNLSQSLDGGTDPTLAHSDLSAIFGIDLEVGAGAQTDASKAVKAEASATRRRPQKKAAAKGKKSKARLPERTSASKAGTHKKPARKQAARAKSSTKPRLQSHEPEPAAAV